MSYYINSDSISIFPLSKPRKVEKTSRLFYEENITNLIRQVVDVDSFIIKSPLDYNSESAILSDNLIFNLYGYYFNIHSNSGFISSNRIANDDKYIVAKIVLSGEPLEISGQDNDVKEYEGLSIESVKAVPTDTDTDKYIVLFKRNSTDTKKWDSYEDSFKKFSANNFIITGIDGKR